MEEFKPLLRKVVIVELLIFALSSFCFFIGFMEIPLGFLLGSTIGLANFFLMYYQFKRLLVPENEKTARVKSGVNFFIRYLIYALGLALALFLQKKGYQIFAWYSVFVGYLMIKIVMLVDNYFQNRQKKTKMK